jgi:adenine-specific DNA-methyltransferase
MRRVLKNNGSLYLFASPLLAARVEVLIAQYFNVLNHVVWHKKAGNLNWTVDKDIQRSYLRNTERIIFAEQQESMLFMRKARRAAGISSNEAARLFPSEKGKLTGCVRNWEKGVTLPPEDKYNRLRTLYPLPPYEDAIRPFNLPKSVAFADVWDFAPVKGYTGKHPCEKPILMLRHIVRTSSRPGAIVLDCFAGSGSTLHAARLEGRQYIGCDAEIRWVSQARHRLDFLLQKPLFAEAS